MVKKGIKYIFKLLELIEEPTHKFHKCCYIPAKYKLEFHLDHLHILGKMNVEQQEKRQ